MTFFWGNIFTTPPHAPNVCRRLELLLSRIVKNNTAPCLDGGSIPAISARALLTHAVAVRCAAPAEVARVNGNGALHDSPAVALARAHKPEQRLKPDSLL